MLAAMFAGCSGKPDPSSELEKAAKALEQAEATQPAPAPAQPAPRAATPAVVPQTPRQHMDQAATSYRNGDYENAVARLQLLRQRATLTPQQNMAVQDAMAAVMMDLYTRAADGDARAQQAVRQYEASKNMRR
jgi:pyruvate/2-oxoglutarate dehydrogenase complex dihydrolipoamide acyltransferase (E2) component